MARIQLNFLPTFVAVAQLENLRAAAEALHSGTRVDAAEAAGRAAIEGAGFASVDYFEVRGADDLARLGPGPIQGPARLLTAARIGRTRLIDNVAV